MLRSDLLLNSVSYIITLKNLLSNWFHMPIKCIEMFMKFGFLLSRPIMVTVVVTVVVFSYVHIFVLNCEI